MPDPLVIHTDLDAYLQAWYKAALAARTEPVCAGVEVVTQEPPPGATFPKKLLVVRDDGGPSLSIVTAERAVGLDVLAGSKTNPKDANDLIRIILAITPSLAVPGTPVAAVPEVNGPFKVDEAQDRARRYGTATLILAGSPLA